MDDNYFLCDRVCTQNTKLIEDILVDSIGGNVAWKMVYNFLGIHDKRLRNLLTFHQNICTVYSNIRAV